MAYVHALTFPLSNTEKFAQVLAFSDLENVLLRAVKITGKHGRSNWSKS